MTVHTTNDSGRAQRFISRVEDVAIDLTKYFDYTKLSREEIEKYCTIPVNEYLTEGGSQGNEAFNSWFSYLAEKVWHTTLFSETLAYLRSVKSPRILSLGCGHGGNELNLARALRGSHELIAVDFNPDLFTKARKAAEAENLAIRFVRADLNFMEIEPESFDLIYSIAALHHTLNLEYLAYQLHRGLKPDGRFIVLDTIGRRKALFWEENVAFADALVKKMPPRYMRRISDPADIIFPYIQVLMTQKGMEGLRQDEIEDRISTYFEPIRLFRFGAFIRLICTHPLLYNVFDPRVEEDRRYLEYLFRLDLQQVEQGTLRPTELFAVFRKKQRMRIARQHISSLLSSLAGNKDRARIPIILKEFGLLCRPPRR